jgi:hypothetical protein
MVSMTRVPLTSLYLPCDGPRPYTALNCCVWFVIHWLILITDWWLIHICDLLTDSAYYVMTHLYPVTPIPITQCDSSCYVYKGLRFVAISLKLVISKSPYCLPYPDCTLLRPPSTCQPLKPSWFVLSYRLMLPSAWALLSNSEVRIMCPVCPACLLALSGTTWLVLLLKSRLAKLGPSGLPTFYFGHDMTLVSSCLPLTSSRPIIIACYPWKCPWTRA